MSSRTRFAASLAAALALAGSLAGITLAAFSATTSNPASSFSAKRIFTGTRTVSAYDIADSSGGSETATAAPDAFADGIVSTTGNWSSAYSTSRYYEVDLEAGRAAGLSVTGATLSVRLATDSTGNTACYYFEVRRASDASVLGTHGDNSGSNNAGCVAGKVLTTVTTSVPEVNTTDVANDLRIRLYAKQSGGKPITFDLVTVTGSTPYASFTAYPKIVRDASAGGAPAATPWALVTAGDGVVYVDASNLPTSYGSTRYVKFTFPAAIVPSGATIVSVTLNHAYKSNTSGPTTCYYLEVYSSGSLIGSHGDNSGSNNVSCATGASFVTDNVTLAEVNTDTTVNGVVIKMFLKSSGSNRAQHDLLTLSVNYYLD